MVIDQDSMQKHLWIDSLSFGFCTFSLTLLYFFLTRDDLSLQIVSMALAGSSLILIGLSYAVSGLSYFWNFADVYMMYRKELGLTGLILLLLHTLVYLYVNPESLSLDSPFMFNLLALLIFEVMTIVSLPNIMPIVGTVWWRRILRFGYVGFILLYLHFMNIVFTSDAILFGLFTVFVVGLRIALEFSLRIHPAVSQKAVSNA